MILQGTTLVLITTSREVTTRLVHGSVLSQEPSRTGRVVTIAPGEIVFYALQARRERCFVFRTLRTTELCASSVPGVSPPVRLLLQTSTRGRLLKLEALLGHLARIGRSPSSLSDAFYLRLHALLDGRLPRTKVLRTLLDFEDRDAACA